MRLVLDFIDETEEVTEAQVKVLENLLNFVAEQEEVEQDSEMSVSFVSNERIQELNLQYRDKDYATDVLSFAMEEMGEDEQEIFGAETESVLGDIVISIPKAKEQAEEYGHSFERELSFLAVHGLLHLLGYDHETEEMEQEMFTKQKTLLDAYGIKR